MVQIGGFLGTKRGGGVCTRRRRGVGGPPHEKCSVQNLRLVTGSNGCVTSCAKKCRHTSNKWYSIFVADCIVSNPAIQPQASDACANI